MRNELTSQLPETSVLLRVRQVFALELARRRSRHLPPFLRLLDVRLGRAPLLRGAEERVLRVVAGEPRARAIHLDTRLNWIRSNQHVLSAGRGDGNVGRLLESRCASLRSRRGRGDTFDGPSCSCLVFIRLGRPSPNRRLPRRAPCPDARSRSTWEATSPQVRNSEPLSQRATSRVKTRLEPTGQNDYGTFLLCCFRLRLRCCWCCLLVHNVAALFLALDSSLIPPLSPHSSLLLLLILLRAMR